MKTLIISAKSFLKIPSVIITYLIMLIATNVVLLKLFNAFRVANQNTDRPSVDTIYYYLDIFMISIILYSVFMFIGYEYMRRSYIGGGYEGIKGRCGKVDVAWFGRMVILFFAALLVTINVSVYFIIGHRFLEKDGIDITYILRCVVEWFFLLSLGALGIGVTISIIKNKIVGYALMIIIVVLVLPNLAELWSDLQINYGLPIYTLRDLFGFIYEDFLSVPDGLYGIPSGSFRIYSMILWVLIALLISASHINMKNKLIIRIIFVFIMLSACTCMYKIYHKGSELSMSNRPDSALAETSSYYSQANETLRDMNDARFAVKKYTMEFKVRDRLYADVTMDLSDCSDDEYVFTLHHGYDVRDVLCNGESVCFTRVGDYVTVHTKHSMNEISIRMIYNGYSSTFYSNKNACFLPQMFAYYPVPGHRTLYTDDQGYYLSSCGISEYDVRVDGVKAVTNLSGGDDHFTGKTDGLTIVSGIFDMVDDGRKKAIIYPMQSSSIDAVEYLESKDIKYEIDKIEDFLGIDISIGINDKTVFVIPGSLAFNSLLGNYYEYNDAIYINGYIGPYDIL